jgi:hypothetical protein
MSEHTPPRFVRSIVDEPGRYVVRLDGRMVGCTLTYDAAERLLDRRIADIKRDALLAACEAAERTLAQLQGFFHTAELDEECQQVLDALRAAIALTKGGAA